MDSDQAKAKSDLSAFFSAYPKQTYPAGRMILSPDDECTDVFYLSSGRVKLFVYSESGSQVILAILGPGTYFPLCLLFGRKTSLYYHQAFSSVVLHRCPGEEARLFFRRNPAVVSALACRLWQGIEGLSKRLEAGLTQTLPVQVASLLSWATRSFGEKGRNGSVILRGFTHQEIADWLGTTREMVSLQMEQLKRKRILEYRMGTIAVHSLHRLERLASSVGVWVSLVGWLGEQVGSSDWGSVVAVTSFLWS